MGVSCFWNRGLVQWLQEKLLVIMIQMSEAPLLRVHCFLFRFSVSLHVSGSRSRKSEGVGGGTFQIPMSCTYNHR